MRVGKNGQLRRTPLPGVLKAGKEGLPLLDHSVLFPLTRSDA